jgi:tetratricopeptide (TPR) repeat protein
VKQYPADSAGVANLALAYFYRRDMERALVEGRRAIEIYPKNVAQRNNLGLYAMYAGDFETAIREQQTVLQMNPSMVLGFVGTALPQLGLGHPEQASETYRRLENMGSSGASAAAIGLADLALYEGRASDASKILDAAIPADLAAKNTDAAAEKLSMAAESQLLTGKPAEAVRDAERALRQSKDDSVMFWAARAYLGVNNYPKALGVAQQLGSRLKPDSQAYAKLIEGEVELQRGKPQEAIKFFLESRKIADTWMGRFDAARAYIEAGAYPEADSELEVCLKRRGEATALFLDESPTYHLFPPVYYYLGRAQEGLHSSAASDSYKEFLAMKNMAPRNPLLDDASRRLRAKLH